MAILDICEETSITSKFTIRHIVRVLVKFSSSFLAVAIGRLHYRVLERFKTESLKEHKGNFDKPVLLLLSKKILQLQSTQMFLLLDGELVLEMDELGVNLIWEEGDFKLISSK